MSVGFRVQTLKSLLPMSFNAHTKCKLLVLQWKRSKHCYVCNLLISRLINFVDLILICKHLSENGCFSQPMSICNFTSFFLSFLSFNLHRFFLIISLFSLVTSHTHVGCILRTIASTLGCPFISSSSSVHIIISRWIISVLYVVI